MKIKNNTGREYNDSNHGRQGPGIDTNPDYPTHKSISEADFSQTCLDTSDIATYQENSKDRHRKQSKTFEIEKIR